MVFFFYTILITLVCGKESRIIGGVEVTDTTTLPWQVAIISRYEEDSKSDYYDRHFCGGSIIDASWILTAAHCLYGKKADEVAIVAGIVDLHTTNGQLRNVAQVYVHEDYNPYTVENDIALLELITPLVLSDYVAIILRANKDDPLEVGQEYTVAGWGATDMDGSDDPNLLYKVQIPHVSLEYCAKVLPDIYDTNICAGGVEGEDSCYGDSGGPLTLPVDSVEKQYGVVSWGYSCATDLPAVYTAVSMYRDWIEKTSGLTDGDEKPSTPSPTAGLTDGDEKPSTPSPTAGLTDGDEKPSTPSPTAGLTDGDEKPSTPSPTGWNVTYIILGVVAGTIIVTVLVECCVPKREIKK